jgi:phosphoribosylformylglycinamidine cyclo-ligase
LLQERGSIATEEMFRAFNMGIGLVVVCANADADRVRELLQRGGEVSAVIGHVVEGVGSRVQFLPR